MNRIDIINRKFDLRFFGQDKQVAENIPTMVTFVDLNTILLKMSKNDKKEVYIKIGFLEREFEEYPLVFKSENSPDIFKMTEKLRDMGIPFATHRTGGADYAVETLRNRGYLSGKFKRIGFDDYDFDRKGPYKVEEF